ncbi:MAG TPA: ribosome biogenesis factor YjgA [Burkholderiales bacterium]|jgi:ribosome-associated protein|nr:ribosome biogenesis factor YjgA [Burkholderiales bacterium]
MEDPERPSKTQLKREMEELQALGARLVEINDERLAAVELPELLREAVLEARRIRSREGRRRQLQYIGKLMRDVDPAPIRARFAEWDGQSTAATAAHHRAERWRSRLLDDAAALTEFARECPGADLQRLHACVREARKDRLAGKPSRHYRELFRLVRAALDAEAAAYNPEP